MKVFLLFLAVFAAVVGLSGCAGKSGNNVPPGDVKISTTPVKKTMRAFESEQELTTYLRELAEKQKSERQRETFNLAAEAPAAATPMAKAAFDSADSVTNVQHAGVDEGGIVKVHGDYLVVLRRGRLFTIEIGGEALQPVSVADAFGPEVDPRNTWYDEMLISEDNIAVIGYSYERGGTEVGLFKIDGNGNLAYQSTYHLRSNDYYSSRNYASRLIGNKLIFYTPLYLDPGSDDPFQRFPAVRKWHKGASNDEFQRIVSATRVYMPEQPINYSYGVALHTVTVCDLSNGGFNCEATAIIGSSSRVFYVSPQAVYVWVTGWTRSGETIQNRAMLYRMPLDGSAPSALGVSGSPVDQFSFLESEDKYINVLVRSDGPGEAMWNAETASGDMALMRVPIGSFSDGSETVPEPNYHRLPKPDGYTVHNRFVGDYLLYGSGSGWWSPERADRRSVFAVRWAGGEPHELPLIHGVDRIEALGSNAIVVGTDGSDLHFTAVRLGESPELKDRYTRTGASQGEQRSHGFFYKADSPDSGVLGLPISVPGRPGYRHLFEGSASLLFLRNSSLHFEEVGEMEAHPDTAVDDHCRASCVDWYGNARPLFVRGRILALLGYEIVEGSLKDGRMREMRRISYAPSRSQ